MNKIHIHEILKDWGNTKKKLPLNNSALKSEILSKLPFSTLPASRPIRTPYPYLSMAFASLAIIVFVGSAVNFKNVYPTLDEVSSTMSYPMAPSDIVMVKSSISPEYYRGNQGSLSIRDKREFMKTTYSADVKTLDVEESASKIEIAVRGLGGRIDSSQSGEDYGHISFALPQYRLDMFRDELLELTGKKLVVEQTNSENLLAQKQYLEEQRRNTEGPSDYLNQQEQNLTDNVATVSGSITLEKVNIWEVADIYVPGPLLAWILILAALLTYFRHKRSLQAYY